MAAAVSKKSMSLDEVVNKCAEDILNCKDVNETVEDVTKYINSLENSETGNKISKDTKKKILSGVKLILEQEEGKGTILYESDNKSYLDVLDLIATLSGADSGVETNDSK